MHLFVVSQALDAVWHLHPRELEVGRFSQVLPSMEQGRYHLFADVVHSTGVPETLEATLDLEHPFVVSEPGLEGDDSEGAGPRGAAGPVATLPGGGRMIWDEAGPLVARRPTLFRFRVEDRDGRPATDLEPYMGMLGHAAFLRRDFGVFAHVHPTGSVPMAALELTGTAHQHLGHEGPPALPSEVSFPYGLPTDGDYRIFVQVKRAGQVQTGVFDAHVGLR
jgi:hypothetical protein